jgi:hypothetical protein
VDNGVKTLPEIPIATTAKHVTTEFEGCPMEFPVLFGSFKGGHTDNMRDPGADGTASPKRLGISSCGSERLQVERKASPA